MFTYVTVSALEILIIIRIRTYDLKRIFGFIRPILRALKMETKPDNRASCDSMSERYSRLILLYLPFFPLQVVSLLRAVPHPHIQQAGKSGFNQAGAA